MPVEGTCDAAASRPPTFTLCLGHHCAQRTHTSRAGDPRDGSSISTPLTGAPAPYASGRRRGADQGALGQDESRPRRRCRKSSAQDRSHESPFRLSLGAAGCCSSTSVTDYGT